MDRPRMNEFDLIARLTRTLPQNGSVVTGPGDDCAVLDLGVPDRQVLFKADAVVEGIHFTAETPPEQIGHKALARCLSDMAAMGGTPGSALVTLGLPREHDVARVEAIYAGMSALATKHGVAIVGGETTTNPERMLISVAMIGTVARNKALLRSGAKAGDAIFVTGELGGSIVEWHLNFEPRVAEGQWLAAKFPVHAMIDVSDGLAGDLRHILSASGVGADLLGKSIPVSRAAKTRARESTSAKPALLAALTDGEDFELLFTIASKQAVPLLDAWKAAFPDVKLTCIGKITTQPGLRLQDERGVRELGAGGYVHFS
jgi:thiamine-monophosphate kinase